MNYFKNITPCIITHTQSATSTIVGHVMGITAVNQVIRLWEGIVTPWAKTTLTGAPLTSFLYH